MEKLQNILNASLVWRLLMSISNWFGAQWRSSAIVSAFLSPSPRLGEVTSRSSLFHHLFLWIQGQLSSLYTALKLDKLLEDSLLRQSALWCCILGCCVALLPTMVMLGMVVLTTLSIALNFIRQRDLQLVYSPANRYLLLYMAVYAFAITISISPMDSLLPGLLSIAFVLTAIVIQNALVTRRQLVTFTAALVLGATLVSLVGIAQYVLGVSGAAAWIDSDMFSSITTRVYSTLQNPNMLAQYLVLLLPLAAALLLSAKSHWTRLLWLGCTGLMCLALILTFSRGGWVGALLSAGIYVLLLQPQLLVLAPFALVALFLVLPDTVVDRFTSIGNLDDSSTSYRVSIWIGSIALLKDFWLCGIGPGTATFNQIYPLYSLSAANAEHPHNLFLQLMVDGGITVLILFLLILFAFCRHICVALSRRPSLSTRQFLIATIAGLGGFLAQGMTDYSFYNHRVALTYWVVLGLGLAWGNFAMKEDTSL